MLPKSQPRVISDRGALVKLIAELYEHALLVCPTCIGRATVDEGLNLALGELCTLPKECDVNSPFVLRTTARGRSIDHDLTLPKTEVAMIQQRTCKELVEEAFIASERRKQGQRLHPCRHDSVE